MARDLTTLPTSPTMLTALKIRTMIASSTTFQARLNVETVEEAEQRIYVNFVQDVDALEKPFAIIQMGPTTHDAVAGGVRQVYLPDGTLKVTFSDNDVNTSDPGESATDFYNFFETTWQDVLCLSGYNGLPKISRSTAGVPMQSAEENAPGEIRFWIVDIDAEWNYVG